MGVAIDSSSVLAGLGLNTAWPTVAAHEAAVMGVALEEAPAAAVQLAQLENGFAQRLGPDGAAYREKISAALAGSSDGLPQQQLRRSIGLYERVDLKSRRRALEILMKFKKRGQFFFDTGFFSWTSLAGLAERLRRDLPVPTVVLTNTGADPLRMALSIGYLLKRDRGKISFPVTALSGPSYLELLPQQLKTFALRRHSPNLTTEIRCSAVDLIHWLAENPDSWERFGNYLKFSTDIFRFGVERGTLRFISLPGANHDRTAEVYERLQSAVHQLGAELVFAEGNNFWDVLHGKKDDAFVENAVQEWAASVTRDLAGAWAKILERARKVIEEIFRGGKKFRGDINPFMALVCQRLGVPVEFSNFIFSDFDSGLQSQIREFLSRE